MASEILAIPFATYIVTVPAGVTGHGAWGGPEGINVIVVQSEGDEGTRSFVGAVAITHSMPSKFGS